MAVAEISPQQLAELCRTGSPEILDVRTPAEYEQVHAAPARLLPLQELDAEKYLRERGADRKEPIYVICRSGARGKQACEKFIQAGFENVFNVQGGTMAWEQAGLPVVRGRKTISVECQVRIISGGLILLGSALGAFVDIAFVSIAAVVGAGLLYSGLTDSCPMGVMLMKMPWNRRKPQATCVTQGA